jgi:hypothetical protein
MVTVQEHPEHAAEMGPSREVSPNRGAAILDISEMGADGMTQSAWRSAYSIEPSKHVKLVKLSHMRYQHPNLQTISTFLRGKRKSVRGKALQVLTVPCQTLE